MPEHAPNPLRSLPSVHALTELPEATGLVAHYGHRETVSAVRQATDERRSAIRDGEPQDVDDPAGGPAALLARAAHLLQQRHQPRLKRVVNATGIILHTGLGRAVMPPAARQNVAALMACCNVQMDLRTGQRVRREHGLRDTVTRLTGAEDCLLVNNNAGATLLVLRALAQGREVIVSRGELIEIGGSFRLPDIMTESGARLREVGTTNKTHARDYEQAIGPDTALMMKAHKSNYRIVGFTKEVGIDDIAAIGKRHGLPVVDDLGSGALVDLESYGLEHELTIAESLQAGADIVLASTDKLIGGPQGGLIVGRKDLLDRIRSHPMYRILRVCKMTLAALEPTLKLFLSPERLTETHPLYATMAVKAHQVEAAARAMAARLATARPDWRVTVVPHVAYLGGGSLPGLEVPSFAVRIVSAVTPAADIAAALRAAPVPVIPQVKDQAVLIDMRTVLPDEADDVFRACQEPPTT